MSNNFALFILWNFGSIKKILKHLFSLLKNRFVFLGFTLGLFIWELFEFSIFSSSLRLTSLPSPHYSVHLRKEWTSSDDTGPQLYLKDNLEHRYCHLSFRLPQRTPSFTGSLLGILYVVVDLQLLILSLPSALLGYRAGHRAQLFLQVFSDEIFQPAAM